jgi:hypothetical protein
MCTPLHYSKLWGGDHAGRPPNRAGTPCCMTPHPGACVLPNPARPVHVLPLQCCAGGVRRVVWCWLGLPSGGWLWLRGVRPCADACMHVQHQLPQHMVKGGRSCMDPEGEGRMLLVEWLNTGRPAR